jgi:hypothetical protein
MNRPIPTPGFGGPGGPPVASPFVQSPMNNMNNNLGPPPPLAPRRPPSNAPPPPPSRQPQQQQQQQQTPFMSQQVGMTTASPLTRSLPPAPGVMFDSSPGGAYVDAAAWTVSNSAGNANSNANLAPPGAFGRARARSRSVGSLDRPNPGIFAAGPHSGAPPPNAPFNNAGGSMRMPPASAAGPPGPPAAAGGPAKPLKPPKTSKLPVGATSGDAFGTVSPPPGGAGGTIGGPIGARSDSSFGVVQPIQPGGSMRLPPSQQMGGSFREVPVGGSLGPRHTSQPNFAISSQPSAMVRGQISPRGAPSQQQQQQQPPPQQPAAGQQLVSGTDQPVERCVCPKCGKLFYFRSDVETHMRLRHT